jgi:hypothetical protein
MFNIHGRVALPLHTFVSTRMISASVMPGYRSRSSCRHGGSSFFFFAGAAGDEGIEEILEREGASGPSSREVTLVSTALFSSLFSVLLFPSV